MAEKAPADHKKPGQFPFTVAGKKYVLPTITEAVAEGIDGGVTMDAVMAPDDPAVQMRLAFATLLAAKPSPAALKALRSLPSTRMLEIVGEWMGESGGSSG